jgi:hypothetical protein
VFFEGVYDHPPADTEATPDLLIKTNIVPADQLASVPPTNRMNSNSNTTTTTTEKKEKKATMEIHLVEYIRKTTRVEMDYKFFNKTFPNLMTEEEFNKFSEVDGMFDEYDWNSEENWNEHDGDINDEKGWKGFLQSATFREKEGLRAFLEEKTEEFHEKMKTE